MVTLYWLLEYAKVFLGYGFLMFVWPSVVFRKFLKGKSLRFWMFFCVTVMVVLNNTVVLGLGLLHILNMWVFRLLFYGVFLWSIFRQFRWDEERRKRFKRLVTGTYGLKQFASNLWGMIRGRLAETGSVVVKLVEHRKWEYSMLGIILLYGMIYFSYGAFQDYSFGSGDMYPHNAWTNALVEGQIFSAGVYPEAMHCFIYSLHALFGINVYSCMLFLQGIHVVIFLLSAYAFLREIFNNRYTPMFALVLFLVLDLKCMDMVYSMSRLQWTVPQEFGLFTVFACAAFLIRYLRFGRQIQRKGKFTKGYWDENLLVFMLALAASLTIHFYPTIMAFFLCVCVVPIFFKKVFHPRRFLPLVAAVVGGVVIAVLPMGGALASGIPFQGSIGWAMSVIEGDDGEEESVEMDEVQEDAGAAEESLDSAVQGVILPKNILPKAVQQASTLTIMPQMAVAAEGVEAAPGILTKIGDKLGGLYEDGYRTLYGSNRAKLIIGITIFTILLCLGYRVVILVSNRDLRREVKDESLFDACLILPMAATLYVALYCPKSLGIPELISGSRVCAMSQFFVVMMAMIPLDMIAHRVANRESDKPIKAFATCTVMGIYLGTMITGTFHGYLYFELSRYNGSVLSVSSITETLPKESYTIVSSTDELYQVIEYGWHEELIRFVNMGQTESYRLPTEYVFIFIEKRPMVRSQSHFFCGPKWLAQEKYPDMFVTTHSQCPEVEASELLKIKKTDKVVNYESHSSTYTNLETKTEVHSRAYAWCREFERLYPGELKTYYEDEQFVCYYFKQNPQSLYQLGFGAM